MMKEDKVRRRTPIRKKTRRASILGQRSKIYLSQQKRRLRKIPCKWLISNQSLKIQSKTRFCSTLSLLRSRIQNALSIFSWSTSAWHISHGVFWAQHWERIRLSGRWRFPCATSRRRSAWRSSWLVWNTMILWGRSWWRTWR